MTSSLVGSEMCIRDRTSVCVRGAAAAAHAKRHTKERSDHPGVTWLKLLLRFTAPDLSAEKPVQGTMLVHDG
eukprot:1019958-Prorocentrum_lima.AAC.1